MLSMFHDQGLPVLKHASFSGGVNVTLGLPIIRTFGRPRHRALDLAGTGRADPGSLFAAVELAITMAGGEAGRSVVAVCCSGGFAGAGPSACGGAQPVKPEPPHCPQAKDRAGPQRRRGPRLCPYWVIKALETSGIAPDIVIGTSAGSVVALRPGHGPSSCRSWRSSSTKPPSPTGVCSTAA